MKIQLLEEGAITPTKATEFSAGFDLYSVEEKTLLPNSTSIIRTGIAIEIPFGCVGILKGRSSLSTKGIHVLAGVIDADFRGEISVVMSIDYGAYKVCKTERIAQLLIIQLAPTKNHLEVVEKLNETVRGQSGFGSSGKFNEEGALNRELEREKAFLENKGLAVMCEHANEVPANCPCDKDCYCKTHTCKPSTTKIQTIHYISNPIIHNTKTFCGIAHRFATKITEDKTLVTCEDCKEEMIRLHFDRMQ